MMVKFYILISNLLKNVCITSNAICRRSMTAYVKLKYLLNLKFYVHVYLSVWEYVHMNVGIPKNQRMSYGFLDLGLQVFVSYSA